MSTSFAVALVLAMSIVALVPLVLVWRVPSAARAVSTFYAVGLSTIVFSHMNPFEGSLSGGAIASSTGNAEAGQCANVVDATRQAGVITDLSNVSRPVVRRDRWSVLPPEAQRAIESCLDFTRPDHERQRPIEIIQR